MNIIPLDRRDDIYFQAHRRGLTVALDTDSSDVHRTRYNIGGSPVVAYIRALYFTESRKWEARACGHDAFIIRDSIAIADTAEDAAARSLALALPIQEETT